jgi:hypothetical protein
MKNDWGQLYTIEGVAAGLIMLLTAFIVVGATTVYTPGDTHINDMQMEQFGNDLLLAMDTPAVCCAENSPTCPGDEHSIVTCDEKSDLQKSVENTYGNGSAIFDQKFMALGMVKGNRLQYNASVYYHSTGVPEAQSYLLNRSSKLFTRDNAVRISRFVKVDNTLGTMVEGNHRPQEVLVDVTLWLD